MPEKSLSRDAALVYSFFKATEPDAPEPPITEAEAQKRMAHLCSVPRRAERLRAMWPERWGGLSDAETIRKSEEDITVSDARRTAKQFPELRKAIAGALKKRGLSLAEV